MKVNQITTASAPGKIILSGEFAMVFGHPGIAVPSALEVRISFEPDDEAKGITFVWEALDAHPEWDMYIKAIIGYCQQHRNEPILGTMSIDCDIPLGKGMGSSTALVIAIVRCVLHTFDDDTLKHIALEIEDAVNPGHSGMDFAVIWNNSPIIFDRENGARPIDLPNDMLEGAYLLDTGTPHEATPELVSWIRERENELADTLSGIGTCTLKLASGASLPEIIQEHHKHQVALGVVPIPVRAAIEHIEEHGCSAKVIGAGGRTTSAGMVLAIGVDEEVLREGPFPHVPLS